jgi:hypothetical protein
VALGAGAAAAAVVDGAAAAVVGWLFDLALPCSSAAAHNRCTPTTSTAVRTPITIV